MNTKDIYIYYVFRKCLQKQKGLTQSKCPFTGEYISKKCYIHIIAYYLSINRNYRCMLWIINLAHILSKRSQSQNHILCINYIDIKCSQRANIYKQTDCGCLAIDMSMGNNCQCAQVIFLD